MNGISRTCPKLLLLLPLFLFACGHATKTEYRIALSQCSDDAWRTKMNEEMRRELLFHPEMTLEIRSADDNSDKQSADIDFFINEKVDLLIVAPNEADGLTDAVARAYDAGIPVIVADRRVNGDKYTAFIGGDNEHVGRLLADYILQRLPDGGNVIELRGLDGSTPAVLRHKGMEECLRGTNVNIVGVGQGEWFRHKAFEEMRRLLAEHPETDLVVAQNDLMAIGAWEAAQEILPDKDIIILGVDALPGQGGGVEAILQGKLDASVSYATAGDLLIQTADKILRGEPFVRDTVIPALLVDYAAAGPLMALSDAMEKEVSTIELLQQHISFYLTKLKQERVILGLIVFFALLTVAYLVYVLRLYRQRKRLSEQLLAAQKEIEEATVSKLTFFTNVSHDFRTPLTLIAGPLSQLVEDKSLTDEQHTLVYLAQKNTHVLLRLINQTLDFRKYESGMLRLHLSVVAVDKAIREWAEAFQPLSYRRHVHLHTHVDEGEYTAVLDVEKTERIFFNLLANAFKFTPENGDISIHLWRDGHNILFSITDTGCGIPDVDKPKIFGSFYQSVAGSRQGSGIGLALVKSFVTLHGGNISVTDNPQQAGSVFTVTLPVGNPAGRPETESGKSYATISSSQILTELEETDSDNVVTTGNDNRRILLAIDDNADIRRYLRSLFENQYTVLTAKDGTSGIQKAVQAVPDVIVCDIAMPDLSGLEVCRRLKTDVATSHIPILMLTARTLDEQRVEGYDQGADAYVCKPFNADVLRAQVASLVDNRARVRETLGAAPIQAAAGQQLRTPDEEFVQRFNELVLAHLDDETLTVETLGAELGMGRTQLYRKLKSLTNYSPNELIRNIRLRQAELLLAKGTMSVAEVAYSTGFSSPSYFTKCYTEFFGIRPSERKV